MDKVLVVQDSPSINVMIKSILEASDFDVDTAETASDGVSKASKSVYDVILLDYMLPDSNGVEVCKILRNNGKTKTLPIVFLSASHGDEILGEVKSAGADGFIGVPFKIEELGNIVRSYMKNNKRSENADFSKALDHFGGDSGLMDRVIHAFYIDWKKQYKELLDAIKKQDTKAVHQIAHTVKGAALTFGSQRISDLAYELEMNSKNDVLEDAFEKASSLKYEIDKYFEEYKSRSKG